MERIALYVIKYTNRLTGERCTYMNVGFETPEAAQLELDRIIKLQNKRPYSIQELLNIESEYLRSWMIGDAWKVEQINIKKHG